MSEKLILTHRDRSVVRLTLDNPPANVLSMEAMNELQASLDTARNDDTTRVIVIAASGSLFSAGHDLKQMTAHRSDADGGKRFFEGTFATCALLMQSIVELPKPVIAEVDGIATAAGCQLVASCDLAFASDRSRFGVNGIDVGLFCSTPAVALTRSVPAKRAMHMLMTGELIDAATALDIGLINRVVASEDLTREVSQCAEVIAAKSPLSLRLGKKAIREQARMNLAEAYRHMSGVMVENMLAADAQEGIDVFLNKRR